MPKNPFVAGAPPRTPLGELTTLPQAPDPLVGWGAGYRHLRRLDLAPSALATRRLDFCPPLQKILAAPMSVMWFNDT